MGLKLEAVSCGGKWKIMRVVVFGDARHLLGPWDREIDAVEEEGTFSLAVYRIPDREGILAYSRFRRRLLDEVREALLEQRTDVLILVVDAVGCRREERLRGVLRDVVNQLSYDVVVLPVNSEMVIKSTVILHENQRQAVRDSVARRRSRRGMRTAEPFL